MPQSRQDTEVKKTNQPKAAAQKAPAAKTGASAPVKKTSAAKTTSTAKKPTSGARKTSAAASGKTKKKAPAKNKQNTVDSVLAALRQAGEKCCELWKKGTQAASAAIEAWRENRAAKQAAKPPKKELTKKEKRRRKKLIWKIVRRTLLCIVTLLLLAVFGVYMVMYTVFKGPSQNACDLLVNSLLETSALKFVPRIYFSEEEVAEIIERNSIKAPDEDTDTSLIVIDRTPKTDESGENTVEEKDIEIVEVSGATYHGYMMIVQDPSRVTLAVCDPEFDSRYGKYLDEMAIENGAVAAINAGGFEDEGGTGKGGKPKGIVVKDGKVLNSKRSSEYNVLIGFDKDDKLIVGDMTADEAVERGIRDAASFVPVLILNGEPAEVSGSSSGLNPRTAIGQRADGAVLLLVIDGRQVNSMGASLADLIDVMMQFGAVNAANLDGGSSSKMWYQGEFVNDGVALTGSRRLPTAFIVK